MPKIKLTDKIKRKIDELLQLETTQLESGAIKKAYRAGWFKNNVAEHLKFHEDDGPSLRTYEVYLQDMRPKRNIPDPLDEPWTLSASIEHNIPPSSTKALLEAWRLCEAIDDTLTIRDARWIAHLSTVITSTPELLLWAAKYGQWEKTEKLLFNKFNSSHLDAAFTMSYFENATASILGKVIPVMGAPIGVQTRPLEIKDDLEEALFPAKISEFRALNKIYIDHYEPANALPLKAYSYQDELPLLKDLNFKPWQLWVYAHWLTALSRGSEWRKMERKQIIEMITELRQWISGLPKFSSALEDALEAIIDSNQVVGYRTLALLPIMPVHLIDKAGFKDAPKSPLSAPGRWQRIEKFYADFDKNKYKLKSKRKKTDTISDKEE